MSKRPVSSRLWTRLWVVLFVVAGATWLEACKLRIDDDASVRPIDPDDFDEIEAEVRSILRRLFPDLSDAEIRRVSVDLDLREVLELRSELEKIRKDVVEFSASLFKTAEERVKEREKALAAHNDGYPEGLEPLGRICTYDTAAKRGEIRLSGVFNGKEQVTLEPSAIELTIDGAAHPFTLQCLAGGPSVDVVFLVDITGSMSNVIDSVRDSVVSFVDLIESSGIRGTVSVVTFQDSVGVNRTFQEPSPRNDYERSPFFHPVSLRDRDRVEELRAFVNRLEANRGADAPENLAGAIDFARNNVIGYTESGAPNVIGDGRQDPAGTEAFPELKSERQVFVVLTDVTFHGDDRTQDNSSLLAPFVPRDARDILADLRATGTTVHVSDPSWIDASNDPASDAVDADYWATHTGGLGEDRVEGYSLVDLELVVVAEKSGLLDITLDRILESSCAIEFEAELSASAKIGLEIDIAGGTYLEPDLGVQRF